jgi:hypothetical protein
MSDRPNPYAEVVVVTKVPPINDAGNLAMVSTPLLLETEQISATNDYRGRYEHFHDVLERESGPHARLGMMLGMRAPVFRLGEILFLDSNGREVNGDMRKPDKWDITVESFGTDVLNALRRSIELTRVS